MYKSLKDANIDFRYEGESFELLPGFNFNNECYERQSNGKSDFINRGNKKILNIKYTPDFIGEDFIIETKGRANESFPLRWKMFKYLMQGIWVFASAAARDAAVTSPQEGNFAFSHKGAERGQSQEMCFVQKRSVVGGVL